MARDVHRALELLEEYHADLIRSSDYDLRYNIERVVSSFKNGLFNALCDFYDNVLLNPTITFTQKTAEAKRFADRWDGPSKSRESGTRSPDQPIANNFVPYSRPSSAFSGVRFGTTDTIGGSGVLNYRPTDRIFDAPSQEWEILEVVINATQAGLGFSISGGSNRPPAPDHHIRVTDINEGGAVYADGRIRVRDIILKVNDVDVSNVPHETAVEALNNSGQFVKLWVTQALMNPPGSLHQLPQPTPTGRPASRQSYGLPVLPPALLADAAQAPRRVILRKGPQGLGFNIVGGESHEPIYISQVVAGGVADFSGQGDVLLRVNDIDLTRASHTEAAAALKAIPPNSTVSLVLQYRPQESSEFFEKLQRQSQLNLSQAVYK